MQAYMRCFPYEISSVLIQVEFVGGPMCWNTRIFSATAGKGSL